MAGKTDYGRKGKLLWYSIQHSCNYVWVVYKPQNRLIYEIYNLVHEIEYKKTHAIFAYRNIIIIYTVPDNSFRSPLKV